MRGVLIAFLCGGLMSIAAPAFADEGSPRLNEVNCEGTDWIEIVNPTVSSIDLGGWLLTDDPLDLEPSRIDHRYTFPIPTAIPSGGHVVVERGSDGFPFGVSCGSDTLRLADAAGVLADVVSIPALATPSVTYGRLPDGSGPWQWTASTPNGANLPAPEAPADPDSSWLFDPLTVNEIDLAIEPDALAALALAPREYVDAVLTVAPPDSDPLTIAVGIRLKGSASFRTLDGKAAFKIKVAHSVPGQRLDGLKALTLNNMVQDPSMIAEATSSHVMRGLGLPAARVGYAFVRLNGAAYGVYANVETVDSVFAAQHFAGTQHIYENSAPGADVTPAGVALLEVDEGSETDRTDLSAVVTAASAPAEAWWSAVSSVIDMPQAIRMWAAEHLVGQWDGYSVPWYGPNNYYLHSDPAGRFSFIPSGTDNTWGQAIDFGSAGAGALFRACVVDATCRDAYLETLATLRPGLDGGAWADFASSVALALGPWQAMDPRKESSAEQFATSVVAKQDVMRARPSALDHWLANPTFSTSSGPAQGVGGGGAGGGEEPGPGPAIVPEPFVADPAPLEGTAAALPTVARLAAVSRAPAASSRLVVVRKPPASRVPSAPRLRIRSGVAVRLSIPGLPAGRVAVDIRDSGTWIRVGKASRVADAGRQTPAFRITRPGDYIVRLTTPGTSAFLVLVVAS